ncbi:hypothetical protein H1C71_025757 [Ictidomys tridecemlineatus]|nr:hypothetical protein H1C71_025757 [Ictidomys tridecemlineatus]
MKTMNHRSSSHQGQEEPSGKTNDCLIFIELILEGLFPTGDGLLPWGRFLLPSLDSGSRRSPWLLFKVMGKARPGHRDCSSRRGVQCWVARGKGSSPSQWLADGKPGF